MTKKNIIKLFIVICWMGVIFVFSAQDAKKSLDTSNKVIVVSAEVVKKRPLTTTEKTNVIKKYKVIIRKTAHFTIYFILGIFIYLFVKDYYSNNKKLIFISILICFLYAASDELHQTFSLGRTPQVQDVLIDTCGSILSIMAMFSITKFKQKCIKNK